MRKLLITGVVVIAAGVAGFLGWQHYAMTTPAQAQSTAQPASTDPDAGSDSKPFDVPLAKAQPDDLVIGDANAPITMIEYSSLSCPHCARFQQEVMPQIKADYIDKGKVKLVMRDFPLNKPALQAATMVHCLSPVRAFAMEDLLFKTQDQWLIEDATEPLAGIAANAGMDRKTFDACLANKDTEAKIVATRKAGEDAFGINATPTFIINGIKLEGEQKYDDMKALFTKLGA
ncbi:MAG TPA: DsbA family protein [Dongiaceae bacterium]